MFFIKLPISVQCCLEGVREDLLAHPLAARLQSYYSTTAILTILQDHVKQIDQHLRGDERLTKWLNPTVNVACCCCCKHQRNEEAKHNERHTCEFRL